MQINSFPLLRTTSDKGVPGQSNPFNVPGCLSPLLSFPALPAERAVGGGEEAVDWLHRRREARSIVMRSWGRTEKEGTLVCGYNFVEKTLNQEMELLLVLCTWPPAVGNLGQEVGFTGSQSLRDAGNHVNSTISVFIIIIFYIGKLRSEQGIRVESVEGEE